MFLNRTVEYALRAMAHLTTLEPGASIRAVELSASTSIPSHYLSKIMRRLVIAGLVSSQKGRGGGFTLKKPASRITFQQILAAVGFDSESGECAFGWGRCNTAAPCLLHDSWSDLKERCDSWASDTRLSSLVKPTPDLVQLRRRR